MTVQLRDYQLTLANQVRQAYKDGHKCPLVVAPTGSGKTVLLSYITHGAAGRGNPVLLAAHRKEIIKQISLSLAKFGIEHSVIAPMPAVRDIQAAHFRAFRRVYVKQSSTTMVGSVQTIVTRMDEIDRVLVRANGCRMLVIMDEAHHVVEDTQWGRVMQRYHVERGALALKVTASPERLDGKGLGVGEGGYADIMIEAPPMSWLIDNGYLSPYRVMTTPKQIDLSGVKSRMGDFVTSQLEEKVDRPTVTGDAVAHWRKHANGMRTVIFCVSISHSKHVAEEFNAAGIPTAHIDGGVDDAERAKAIMDFADGKILVLTQVNLVSEGFDLGSIAQKDVTIDCLLDLAPTQSLVNAMQRWGRALRPRDGKIAVILDHAGNVLRHGLPDMHREWSLQGREKGKRGSRSDSDAVNVRTCPKCFAIHEPIPTCPACGFLYPIQNRTVEHVDGQLVELTSADRASLKQQMEAQKRMEAEKRKREDRKAGSLEELVALGKSRGYKFPVAWAAKKWEAMQRAREHHRAGVY